MIVMSKLWLSFEQKRILKCFSCNSPEVSIFLGHQSCGCTESFLKAICWTIIMQINIASLKIHISVAAYPIIESLT